MNNVTPIVGIVFTGDSLTFSSYAYSYQWAGVQASEVYDESSSPRIGFRAWPRDKVVMTNYALSGWRLPNLIDQAPSLDALICNSCPTGGGRPSRKYILVVRIGTNVSDSNPVTFAASVRSYCLARQAAGWNVVLCPIPSNTSNIINNFELGYSQPFNSIISSWTQADGVSGVVSSSDEAMYGTSAASVYTQYWSTDKVHPLEAGHTRLKNDLDAVLTPLISQLQGA